MIISTQDHIMGYEIVDVIGLVQGNTVRTRHIGRDFIAGLKNIVGGEISSYTELLSQAREEAVERMVNVAKEQGADAILAVRFETSDIMQAASEIFVYGTAVKLRKN